MTRLVKGITFALALGAPLACSDKDPAGQAGPNGMMSTGNTDATGGTAGSGHTIPKACRWSTT